MAAGFAAGLATTILAPVTAQARPADDLQAQGPHDVNYLRYWVDEGAGMIFCLVDAPSPEAAHTVHRKAHGLVADAIYQVKEGS
jgi:hypothetical protein